MGACGCDLMGGAKKHVHSRTCIHNKNKSKTKRTTTHKRKTYKAKGGFRYGRSKFGRTPTPGEKLISSSRTRTKRTMRK